METTVIDNQNSLPIFSDWIRMVNLDQIITAYCNYQWIGREKSATGNHEFTHQICWCPTESPIHLILNTPPKCVPRCVRVR
jgi:hypothetical protein